MAQVGQYGPTPVLDNNGNPIPNAAVTIRRAAGGYPLLFTDATGGTVASSNVVNADGTGLLTFYGAVTDYQLTWATGNAVFEATVRATISLDARYQQIGTSVQVAQTQGGTPLAPASATQWTFNTANNFNATGAFSSQFLAGTYGGHVGTAWYFGYNIGQAMAAESAGYISIFADAEDTPGGATELNFTSIFPDGTSVNSLQVVAKKDNTHVASLVLSHGQGAGSVLTLSSGGTLSYLQCYGATSAGAGTMFFRQPNVYIGDGTAATGNATVYLQAPTSGNASLVFTYNGAGQWQWYQTGGGNIYLRDLVNSKMHIQCAPGAGATGGTTTINSAVSISGTLSSGSSTVIGSALVSSPAATDCALRINAPAGQNAFLNLGAAGIQWQLWTAGVDLYVVDNVNFVYPLHFSSAAGVNGKATFGSVLYPVQATTAAAPAYVKGGVYFDTTLNKLRVGGASAWETVTSA